MLIASQRVLLEDFSSWIKTFAHWSLCSVECFTFAAQIENLNVSIQGFHVFSANMVIKSTFALFLSTATKLICLFLSFSDETTALLIFSVKKKSTASASGSPILLQIECNSSEKQMCASEKEIKADDVNCHMCSSILNSSCCGLVS